MTDKPSLKTVMWRLLQARKVVTYDDLQELSGASRSHARKWIAERIKEGVVRRLPQGRYQLVANVIPGKPEGKSTGTKGAKAHPPATRRKMPQAVRLPNWGKHPEPDLWQAMQQKKTFTAQEILDLDIAPKTSVAQYLAMLTRAGFLTKEKIGSGRAVRLSQYTVAKVTGSKAPEIGRTWYLYDPNTNEVWDDIAIRTINKPDPGNR